MYEIGGGRGSRCHYHERAQSVPSGATEDVGAVPDGEPAPCRSG